MTVQLPNWIVILGCSLAGVMVAGMVVVGTFIRWIERQIFIWDSEDS